MITIMALYFFIGFALAAGIAAYNRFDAKAVYQIEKVKIAYAKGEWKQTVSKLRPNFRRVQAAAV